MLDPTKRFSNRVENYVKYRPGYPSAIIPLLEKNCGLRSESVVADIGSGTGLLTELFLRHGNHVFGVEPNAEMRAAGEHFLAKYQKFVSIEGGAEATTLAGNSLDFITAGQSFHWFNRELARKEFERILKARGLVVLIWNGINPEKSRVIAGYQDLMQRYGTDFGDVTLELADSQVELFYSPGSCKRAHFEFKQFFDLEGLKGRFLSASYAPDPGSPNYEPFLSGVEELFGANQKDGKVAFDYDTEVYYGQLRS